MRARSQGEVHREFLFDVQAEEIAAGFDQRGLAVAGRIDGVNVGCGIDRACPDRPAVGGDGHLDFCVGPRGNIQDVEVSILRVDDAGAVG